jgi:RNA polymerase sigma-70 factor (ECF subfamily)
LEQQTAFEQAYEKYGAMLYRVAAVYLRCHQDAEDACQTVFVRLLTRKPGFRDTEHERAWLLRAAANVCKDILKRRERKNIELTPDIAAEQEGGALEEIMALPVLYREALTLHYYTGYTVAEIARMLRVSPSAVKMRLSRGREMLKLEMERE